MIELARGLSPRDLRDLAALERRALAADGGRLKLEWQVLRARAGQDVEDVLWWEDNRLLGFLGLYAFGAPTVEIAGMVHPAARRRGIATALLAAAVAVCRERGYQQALLVTPHGSAAGRAFAQHQAAVLEHSEHVLLLLDAPIDGPADPRIALRTAASADAPQLSELLAAAFGEPPVDLGDRLVEAGARTVVVELDDLIVGTIRVTRDGDTASIYGFAVDPGRQGRGIGRDVLRRVCHGLREDGVQRIGLEVAVENDHALGLYTSLGFIQTTTEDYYEIPLAAGTVRPRSERSAWAAGVL
jgi:ribosomal protein S18 acetylase RimI-like enzyme